MEPMSLFSPGGNNSLGATDDQIFSRIRVILAFAALLAIYINPTPPERSRVLIYTILILFNFYAVILYFLKPRITFLNLGRYSRWPDIFWCVILLAASGGTDSIFVFLFILPILGSSFRFGYEEGLRVTLISVLLVSVIGFFSLPHVGTSDSDFWMRIVFLAIFGYIFAYLGGTELTSKSRLELLKDINKLSNPRFGVDQTLGFVLAKILNFFDADSAYLIMSEPDASGYFLRQCDRSNPDKAVRVEAIDDDHLLLKWIKPGTSVCYQAAGRLFGRRIYFNNAQETEALLDNNLELIADILNVNSYVSVPLYRRENAAGRIYLTSQRKSFKKSDAEFLHQVLQQAASIVENIYLVDRLASEATERERQRIGRDIHDTTIQPYIGLKLGLEAIQMKQAAARDLGDDIPTLIAMVEENISSILQYIIGLKGGTIEQHGVVLVSAIRQQAKKLSEFYGIDVGVNAENNIRINDRLSAEVFQIVAESLSNIRRHTNSKSGSITIECKNDKLSLEIRNDHDGQMVLDEFTPKSISGRAESLGGHARVQVDGNQTKVLVEIPI